MISGNYRRLKTPVQPDALIRWFGSAPPGKLFCVHGDPSVFRLSLHAAARALLRGSTIALVDGTNRFDPYFIAEFARRVTARGYARVTPEELLQRIFIARAFTCYQMEATITDRLPAFLEKTGSKIAMIFGLLDTFYDEQAPMFEVRGSVQRVIAALRQLRQSDISVLLASADVKPGSSERNGLMPQLLSSMDQVFFVREDGGLMLERGPEGPVPGRPPGSAPARVETARE